MKECGMPKCVKTKWNTNPAMEQKTFSSLKSKVSRSVIQVDEDLHFVLDSSDVELSHPLSGDKSMDLSRKTYSKKNPIAYHPYIPQEAMKSFENNFSLMPKAQISGSLKNSTVTSGTKILQRKRKKDFDLANSKVIVPPKMQKTNPAQKSQSIPHNCANPRLPKSKSSCVTSINDCESSDSDIEVVAMKIFKPITIQAKSVSNSMKKFPNAQTSLASKKKNKYFETEVNANEVIINEADIAPLMPTNPNLFPEARGATNSLRWLSANGTLSVPGLDCKGFSKSNGSRPNRSDNQPLFLPEMKVDKVKKPKGKRELKGLYENLNEIAWAHETSFKNLLKSPDYIRHSERSTGRIAGTGKNLRTLHTKTSSEARIKGAKKKNAATIMARKKCKMARLNQKLKLKPIAIKKASPVIEKNNKSKEKQMLVNGVKKKMGSKTKALGTKRNFNEDTDILYKLNPLLPNAKLNATKIKVEVPKGKICTLKPKPEGQKMKLNSSLKSDVPKAKSNVALKSEGSRGKSTLLKLKIDGQKRKSDLSKFKPRVSSIKPEDSPPSTSGLQNGSCNGKSSASASHSKNNNNKPSSMKNFLNKFDNCMLPAEVQMLQGYLGKDSDLYSAFQKGSKLRVRLKPLEHTKLWTPEYHEDFRKNVLDQALRRALENTDNESINFMYQELLDSFTNSQNNNNTSGNKVKRKKIEEEALRTSIRQSEGAFRYKEIVVKKHPNYMQVVLVPNEVKQNSLTVEAMKELKDAFLLAKKDPNCRAVLLNSSGTYFCTGVDLSPLVGSNKRQAAEEMSNSIRDLVMTLGMFTKPVVAAVNGACLGFGVSILTFCDVVLASDKATFCLPATRIGYIPEGGVTLTLPQVVGSVVASEMFLQGRRLTAEQALKCGLVSEVLWPTKLMNEVIPRLQNIISQSLPALEATKMMVRYHLWDKLRMHIEREHKLLCEYWLGAQCQNNIKTLLQTGWLLGD